MHTSFKRILIASLFIFVFESCAHTQGTSSSVQGVTDTTIKVGSWGPIKGPSSFALWGTVLQSMDAYFNYVNANGGVHGRKIEFVFRDDSYDPEITPSVAKQLVEEDKVFAVIGGVGTRSGRAVADYLENSEVPFFSPASGDSYWVTPGKRNVYTVFPQYYTEGKIMGEYIAQELRSLKVGVLYQDDAFGQQGAAGLRDGIKRFGGTLIAEIKCTPQAEDLSAQAEAIMKNPPEVLVIFAAPGPAILTVKELDKHNKRPHILTSFVLSDPMMFDLAGKGVWENVITSSVLKVPTSEDPSVKKFREVLRTHGGEYLAFGAFTLAGFAMAQPFVEALHRAGPNLTAEAFYNALNSFQEYGGGGPYWVESGLGPPISFGPQQRLGNDKLFFAKATNGEWIKVSDWFSIAHQEAEVTK